ncbi:hypothetical protein GJ744_002524 [Endocarpon pusillum]|uniref:AB hydrolase-1 domain-containing protein n=1 Tax=Endocarpon pusillum TaxID=364733 RepID=A0A8H7E2M3_9EURO|nr:hypothetical protein GJ744_002524 [Endocarpon pusillum]
MCSSFTTQTVEVPHLGGIRASYHMPYPYDSSKPTLILVNSFTTNAKLYNPQYANKSLTDTMNLLAIELLGHGGTRALKVENWTYWDTAIMNLQVMEKLGLEKVFALGTSQGGWVTVRMALLAPDKILGIIALGTSLSAETPHTISLGCWDCHALLTPSIDSWTTNTSSPDFVPDDSYCNHLVDIGFGENCEQEVRKVWVKEIKDNYGGDEGRRRIRMAAINLRDRDGLRGRLWDVRCPVIWLHGTNDVVYSIANAKEEIKLFENARATDLVVVEGGAHFLSATHPKEVDEKVIEFVGRWGLINDHV